MQGCCPSALPASLTLPAQQRQHLYASNQPPPTVDPNAYAVVEIRKLIDQQIIRGVAPSVAVVTSVLSYFYSWTSSKVPHHRPPPSTTTTAPPLHCAGRSNCAGGQRRGRGVRSRVPRSAGACSRGVQHRPRLLVLRPLGERDAAGARAAWPNAGVFCS